MQKTTDEDHLRCPCDSCHGLISYLEDRKPFWGCGECGSIWLTKADLFEAITDSIKKHPYRAKKGNNFVPVPLEDEPENYEKTVARE